MSSLEAIVNQFGLTTNVDVKSLWASPFTRTGTPYRVNPFQQALGNAPSEFSAPHSIGDFQGYAHTSVALGSNVQSELRPAAINITWSAPAGYNPLCCKYEVYWKPGTVSAEPITAPVNVEQAGDSTSFEINTASVGQNLAVCVIAVFQDGTTEHDSAGFPGGVSETDLTGSDQGIWTDPVPAGTPNTPTVQQINPTPAGCTDETTCTLQVTVTGSISGYNKTLEYEINNSGTWNVLTTTMTGSGYSHTGRPFSDTYRYRVKYTGETNYSAESSPISPLCGPE